MPDGVVAGPISLLDSRIDFDHDADADAEGQRCGGSHGRVAVSSNRSVYLRHVYIRGAESVARLGAGSRHEEWIPTPAASPTREWSAVFELAPPL